MKRLISISLALLLFLQFFSFAAFAVNDSGSPKHIPRVVSVVFDDSGSMYNETDRWAYTSYAMQSFVAMMGSEDVLYVTYLNAAASSVRIDLSDGGKQRTIDNIEKTVFGGGTDNKLSLAAECLKNEHSKLGANAKYYYVVMADGELDKGEMSVELNKQVKALNNSFTDADLETIYFSMKKGDSLSLPDVTTHTASSGNEIVSVLRDISADVMGRTMVDFSVSSGKVSFSLPYPALNIAVFVQKENKTFNNVSVPITKDGKPTSYQVKKYYVDCPTKIVKNENHTKYNEIIPSSPPSGFVSLINNGSNSLPKGNYTLDLSAHGITKNNVVVMVEPAVRIGCQYFKGDSTTPISFSELKNSVRDKDTIKVKCGLYEINSDGSLGSPVPLNVLSPKYSLYVNNKSVGSKVGDNEYQIIVSKPDFDNKDLKIEAVLKGYQPFVIRETFGEIKVKLNSPDSIINKTENLTKPLWSSWTDGTKSFEFSLNASASASLNDLSIKVENAAFLPSGKCSALKNNISTSGNKLIYKPSPAKNNTFNKLPQNFKISLYDDVSGEPISSVTVNVIQPQYKLEATNEIGTVPFTLESLKNNTKALKFSLLADYDGTGTFGAVNQNNCESDIKLTVDSGVLPGNTTSSNSEISFVPAYNAVTNTEVPPTEIFGKTHSVVATAIIDGTEVKSEPVVLTIGNAAYKIVVDNPIQTAFTLDSIKNNKQKITFSLLADYTGDGSFGAVEEWDYAIYDKLTVNAGELPGVFKTEYDSGKNPIGKSFTPLYDENNNNGVVFTKVAGKTHKIIGILEAYNISAETTTEVLAPVYEIKTHKSSIEVINTHLNKNTEGVEFAVLRNGRALTAEELENLENYSISLSPDQKRISIKTSVRSSGDTSYIVCKPVYTEWKFVSQVLCLLKRGDVTVTLSSGESSATATIKLKLDWLVIIIVAVVAIIIAVLAFLFIAYLTRIKFEKGNFYIVSLEPPNQRSMFYHFSGLVKQSPNNSQASMFFLKPIKDLFTQGKFNFELFNKELHYTLEIGSNKSIDFKTKRSSTSKAKHFSYPHAIAKTCAKKYRLFNMDYIVLEQILEKDTKASYSFSTVPIEENDTIKMDSETALFCKNDDGSVTLVFYLSLKKEKETFNQKTK